MSMKYVPITVADMRTLGAVCSIHTHEKEKLAHAHVEVATGALTHVHLHSDTHTQKNEICSNLLKLFDLMQQLFHQLSMEQSYNVGISALHGNIVHIDVEAQTLVKGFQGAMHR